MKHRKRLVCFLLVGIMLTLTACAQVAPDNTTPTTVSPTAPTVAETTAPTVPTEPPEMHTIYVCTEQIYTAVDSVGSMITQTYDAVGNMIMDNYASNDGKVSIGSTFTYDDAGKILTLMTYEKYDIQNITCNTTYTYDGADRVIQEEFTDNQGNSGRVEYTYREDGKLAEKVLYQEKNQERTVYTYDEAGQLTKEELFAVSRGESTLQSYVNYTYNAQGNTLSRIDSSGYQELWTYDEKGNILTYQELDHTGYLIAGTVFEYDEPNRIKIEYPFKGDMENPLEKYIYEFDEAGRLAVKYICTPNSNRQNASQFIHYTYDEKGNLLTEVCTNKKGEELSRREYTYVALDVPVKG